MDQALTNYPIDQNFANPDAESSAPAKHPEMHVSRTATEHQLRRQVGHAECIAHAQRCRALAKTANPRSVRS